MMVAAMLTTLAASSVPAQTPSYTVLYTFTGPDGAFPAANLIVDSAGNFYGTTSQGGYMGALPCDYTLGCGVVFELGPSGNETVLYKFEASANLPFFPAGGVVLDPLGNLYGATGAGGRPGGGVAYELAGASFSFSELYAFGTVPKDGTSPYAGLIRDSAGNLYGTTGQGGAYNFGTVVKVYPGGKEGVLYSFTGTPDGRIPDAPLILDSVGNLYCTTEEGGVYDAGTVFELNSKRAETVLYSFTGGADGAVPVSSLLRDSAGNLYGTTLFGGITTGSCSTGCGVAFKIDTAGSETVLHAFRGPDGEFPGSSLVRDASGNLYGTTEGGGAYGHGVVFKISPTGTETLLYSFTGAADGNSPIGGLLLYKGQLYGTSAYGGDLSCNPPAGCGVIFKLGPG